MQAIDLTTAKELIDFSGGDDQLEALGNLQLKGAVALQNMLADPSLGVGYLADEVGMGKTYVALGVVALMRCLNPSLRVLYICPSTNVQEKWCYRELPAFIKTNLQKEMNFSVRSPQGEPSLPAVFCSNVGELFEAATKGYYADFFVRMSSFSMAMGDKPEDLKIRLDWLRERVPANLLQKTGARKPDVKDAYAKALNYLLPTFDLVVIDEAHNFKHPFESSARNLALSRILGFNKDAGEQYVPRARHALLLSATPFDVNPEQLLNQLKLVGKGHLLPERDSWGDKQKLKAAMAKFMVRRLNTLNIRGTPHTRNMYRREWRKGDQVEILLPSDEHKLITALVQKHVGEMLDKKGGNPAFQIGLLASFESYAQTTRTTDAAMFDGDETDNAGGEAPDRHLIDIIRNSYVDDGKFGQTLPHPKMDQVSRSVALQALQAGRKQLVFVRRVKSVTELKQKLDSEYNDWLEALMLKTLSGHAEAATFMRKVIEAYGQARKDRDDDISGGDVKVSIDGDDEQVLPKTDTLFNWFFRGEKPDELDRVMKGHRNWPAPENLKKSLIAKNNANVLCFEFNWFGWIAKDVLDEPLDELIDAMGLGAVLEALEKIGGVQEDDQLSAFMAVQVACLRTLRSKRPELGGLEDLEKYLHDVVRSGSQALQSADLVERQLRVQTFFDCLRDAGLATPFFSSSTRLRELLCRGERLPVEEIRRVDLHRQLIAQSFRTGHPFVDLFLARLKIGDADVNEERRQQWLHTLCEILAQQRQLTGFNSAWELTSLNENLDLVIKNNLPKVYAKRATELRVWLNQELPSSAPVIGANGETRSSRSVQARKFRMPGYPLVLVSTDVFQEGEDLHTFCDSVVHYGLSASPVSIEQKTGRVDRVGAHAHRRLLGLKENDPVADEDFIQVRFPYVKQSIEAVQVRVLARRMNEFLGSLHEIGGKVQAMDAFIDSSRELAERQEIPDQLLKFLESPYIPSPLPGPNKKLMTAICKRAKKVKQALQHVKDIVDSLAESVSGSAGHVTPAIDGLRDQPFEIKPEAARANGEILLRARRVAPLDLLSLVGACAAGIRELQGHMYVTSLARTYAVRVDNGLALYQDAEILVGDKNLTCQDDVLGLFRRFLPISPDESVRSGRTSALQVLNGEVLALGLQKVFNWNGTVTSKAHRDHIEYVFKFHGDGKRRHVVRAREMHGYCVLEAMVSGEEMVRSLSRDRLLELTWLRNRSLDLVEAVVRQDGCLIARTLHPLRSMSEQEFAFSAYLLAVEADRLEYLIKLPDDY